MTGDFAPAVRLTESADAAELLRLAALLREHLDRFRGGDVLGAESRRSVHTTASLRGLIESPDDLVAVGCLGEVIVGYLVAEIEHSGRGPIAIVTELFVEPPARDVGVGSMLMNEAIGWASRQGCLGIDSVALPGDRDTKNFFESFGLVARSIIVHRRLDQ